MQGVQYKNVYPSDPLLPRRAWSDVSLRVIPQIAEMWDFGFKSRRRDFSLLGLRSYLGCMEKIHESSRRMFMADAIKGALSVTMAGGMITSLYGQNNSVFLGTDVGERKFVPVMLTPYKEDLSIDYAALSALTDFYLASGAKGFFANCLSSEMYDLSDTERLSLVRHVVKQVNGRFPVVATGSFGNTIASRADYTKKMFDTGVDGVILITSHFAAKDEDDAALLRNMEKYFSLTGNIPLGTYECPSPYKRILTPEVLKSLLSTDRLVYHKDTSLALDKIKAKLAVSKGSRLEFYDAHTPNALYSLQMGAKGMSCIAGNFYPEIFSWMCDRVVRNPQHEDLEWIQGELTRTDSVISQGYSLTAKHFLQKRGVPITVNSRKKNTSITRAQKEAMEGVYRQLLGWHERLGIKV